MTSSASYQDSVLILRAQLAAAAMHKKNSSVELQIEALQEVTLSVLRALQTLKNDKAFWSSLGKSTARKPAANAHAVASELQSYLPTLLHLLGMKEPPPPSPEDFVAELTGHLQSAARGVRPSAAQAKQHLASVETKLIELFERYEPAGADSTKIWELLGKVAIILTLAVPLAGFFEVEEPSAAPPAPVRERIIIVPVPTERPDSGMQREREPQSLPNVQAMQEGIGSAFLHMTQVSDV